jgi:glutamate carboxypeptidase
MADMNRVPRKEIKAISGWLRQHSDDILSLTRQLVEMESPSNDPQALNRLAQFLAEQFRGLGGRVQWHRRKGSGDHLEIQFGTDVSGQIKPVMLLGHHDTVWETRTLRAMPWRRDKGRIRGPGVLDMKAGIAQMIFALRALLEVSQGPRRPVSVLLVSDEEVGSGSSRELTESLAKKSAAVLVMEPAQGQKGALKTSRKGVGEFKIEVSGRAAHAGVDFAEGASATLELARQMIALEKFIDSTRGITVNPGVIHGGTRSNVVAAQAEALVDVRIAKAADAARLEKQFRRLKPFDRRCKLKIEGGINRPPMERSPAIVKLFTQAKIIAGELGWRLDEAATGGGSDGNFTAALGVPTLDGLGGVGEGAHALHESALISEIPRRTALLACLIETV